jgi:hypothetical protein
MLIANNIASGAYLKFLSGGALSCFMDFGSRHGWSLANRIAFGPKVSFPQGYSNLNAIKLAFEPGRISARLQGSSAFTSSIQAAGKMEATLTGEGSMSPGANMAYTSSATFAGEGFIDADITAAGRMSATLDAGARPSAFDIAQEVWQAQATSYNAAGTMGEKLNDAGSAGNPWTTVIEDGMTAEEILKLILSVTSGDATGMEGATVTFKSQDGTKNRLVATISGGNRTVTSKDVT